MSSAPGALAHTLESRQGDRHWNGSLWRDCTLGVRSTQTQRDAQGRSAYDYCDGYERGTSSRTVVEQLVAVNPGTPCTESASSDAGGSSLNPNVWWMASSVSLGTVAGGAALPAGTANYFTTSANLRVAFTGGTSVKYFSCYVRTTTGGNRNCTQIGTGSYAIQTLGDGRAMTFNNLPAIAQRLSFERVFVERGGTVYFGYRNAANITRSTVRLNLPAANAVLGTLGIAAITP